MAKRTWLGSLIIVLLVFSPMSAAVQAEPDAPQAGWTGHVWSDTFADGTAISSNTALRVTDTTGGAFGESFTPYAGNPLFTIESSDPWDSGGDVWKQIPGAVHPDVQYFPEGMDGYEFWMIFTPLTFASTPPDGTNDYHWERPTLVRSHDGIHWVKTSDYTNPLISPGTPPAWDDDFLADPDFVYAPNEGPNEEDWFLYYSGANPQTIGVALSQDGKHYTKYSGNPVVPGTRCASVIYNPTSGTFHMWFNVGSFTVGYATSLDGINWTPYNSWSNVVYQGHPGTYDQGGVTHMDVVYFGGLYHMYYMALPTGAYSNINIGHATSPDGISWTQSPNPVMVPGGETWTFWGTTTPATVRSFYRPSVVVVGETLYMYYGGVDTDSSYPAPHYDLGLAFPSEPNGHVELSAGAGSAEYPARPEDTLAWYHMNESNPPDPTYPGEYDSLDPTLAWYHFNEGSGTTTADAAVGGIADTGTLIGPPTWNTAGLYTNSLSYDGNDRIEVADSSDLNPATGITIEAWVNPSVIKANNYILSKTSTGLGDFSYGFKLESGWTDHAEIGGIIHDGTNYYYAYGGNVPNNTWTHVAMTYQVDPANPTQIRLYQNGVEVTYRYTGNPDATTEIIPAGTLIRTNSAPMHIGHLPTTTEPKYFQGSIDELRVLGRALTPTEIAADGEIVSYPTPAVQDASGNNNHGTPLNGVSREAGRFANGLRFNGTSAYVDVPDAASLDPTDGITIEAWVNPSVTKQNNYVACKASPGYADYAYGLKVENSEVGGIIGDTSEPRELYFAYGGNVPINTWTHIAMTYQVDPLNTSHIRLYQNGVEVTYRYTGNPDATTETIPAGTQIRANAGPLNIGMIPASPYLYMNGMLDEVRILNRALTPEEIAVDYGARYASLGVVTSVVITPPAGEDWALFDADDSLPTDTEVTYRILDETGTTVLMDDITSGAILTALGNQPIRLRATLSSSSPIRSPRLESWSLTSYDPTAVITTSFQGQTNLDSVTLRWETASEIDLIGFNVYRSLTFQGIRTRQNMTLIPAIFPGQLLGSGYEFSDPMAPGQVWYYWLEVVGTSGSEWLDPLMLGPLPYRILVPMLVK